MMKRSTRETANAHSHDNECLFNTIHVIRARACFFVNKTPLNRRTSFARIWINRMARMRQHWLKADLYINEDVFALMALIDEA